jgi:hypothetical protein
MFAVGSILWMQMLCGEGSMRAAVQNGIGLFHPSHMMCSFYMALPQLLLKVFDQPAACLGQWLDDQL